jgi:hypothetical protein
MILVESIFNKPQFKRKQRIKRIRGILENLVWIFLLMFLINENWKLDQWRSTILIAISIMVVVTLLNLWSWNSAFHNLKIKSQINEIALKNDELIITNYANEKISIRKDECILYPVTDEQNRWYGRHKTDLRLTLENGSCFYIYQELFNTHQIEDWISDDRNKRYYQV